ncbi:MAG: GNAT family N-acetyltransferase [Pseudomonadota bacterium]
MGQHIEIVPTTNLDASHWQRWLELQSSNPALDSPYFHPHFAQALQRHGLRTLTAVISEAGQVVAFVPYQTHGRLVGRPGGWPIADFQAPVCADGFELDLLAFLRAGGLDTFTFDHWLAQRPEIQQYVERTRPSPYMDVSGGLARYLERIGESGQRRWKFTQNRLRKVERELGSLRLEFQSTGNSMFDRLLEWKRSQYRETGSGDLFANPAYVAFFRDLLRIDDAGFRGLLSVLWAGETPLAAHAGIALGGVLHWWFPAYDPRHAGYSPGYLMLAKLTEDAPLHGLTRVDLGKGEEQYKAQIKTGQTMVAEGIVDVRPARQWLRAHTRGIRAALKYSAPAHWLRQARKRLRAKPKH